MQCPRSELWGACLRYGRVASQFLARTKSCNFNCPSDAARANMPFQVTSGSLTASARIEDSSSQALIHETTPAATVQLEQKPQGLPAEKCAHPDVLLELDGQSNSEQNSSTSDTTARTGAIATNYVSPTQLWRPSGRKVGASKEALTNRTPLNQIRKDKRRDKKIDAASTFGFKLSLHQYTNVKQTIVVAHGLHGSHRGHHHDDDSFHSRRKEKGHGNQTKASPAARHTWKYRRKSRQRGHHLLGTTVNGPYRQLQRWWKYRRKDEC